MCVTEYRALDQKYFRIARLGSNSPVDQLESNGQALILQRAHDREVAPGRAFQAIECECTGCRG